MRLFKRGSCYWYEFVFEGQRIQRSSKVKNRRDADIIASAYKTALAKGEVGIIERKPVPSLGVAMKDFLAASKEAHKEHPATAKRYVVSSAALLRYFGQNVAINRITTSDVTNFRIERLRQVGQRTRRPLRPATVNREVACLKAMFNHAIGSEVISRNPVSGLNPLEEENQQDRVLTFKEQAFYLAHATPTLRDVATLMLETGMRPEEVYGIEVSNVHLPEGFLIVPKGKTPAARRRVNLTAVASSILQARIKAAKGRFIFPCETDATRPIPKVSNAHDRALRDSRVRAFKLYACRHTWATRAAQSGIDLVTLASMLGHSKINMVMRYAHPTQSHQKMAMERFEQHTAAQQIKEFGDASLQ